MIKKTILVLEDEQTLQSAIKSSLINSGFNVLHAKTAQDGLIELKSSKKIDAIWLDHYIFGEKNGLDFLRELKNEPIWTDIPVFVVTNSVSDDKVDAYEVLGIEKYFVKSNNSLSSIVQSIKNKIM